ncbi:TlpA family protein disulfide reductase [Andreprevotia chitinilytica]|uniref:TlpA family protein disulfide reductase n=1 Tax=Andreprevotia chitinilytica TaxID=396808 RepID=UPI0006911BC3|nr:TlpA disulfide reductase family protein [Andreprevotia chitinilytica]
MRSLLIAVVFGIATLPALAATSPATSFFDAHLKGLDGKSQALSQFRDKPIVVNYWATWCGPCREEIPEFVQLSKKYAGKVQFIGIAVDDVQAVTQFARDYKISYPLFPDETASLALLQSEGNPDGKLPFTVVYDGQGKKVTTKLGRMKGDALEAVIKNLK